MRHVGLLTTRVVLGGYMTVHGVQKLFGSFGGPGLASTATGFESHGLRPEKAMAALAGASQLTGGVLTVAGVADPLGPMLIAGNMTVASAFLRKQGAMSKNGGFESPLIYLAAAISLMSSGSGRFRFGPPLPKALVRICGVAITVMVVGSLAQLLRAKPNVRVSSPSRGVEPNDLSS